MKENKTLKVNHFLNENSSDDNNFSNNNNNNSENKLVEFDEESSNIVNCNSLLITPYKPNEINNEIYPNEDKIPTSFKENIV